MFNQILGNKSREIANRFGRKAYKTIKTGVKVGAGAGLVAAVVAGQVHRSGILDEAPDLTREEKQELSDFDTEFVSKFDRPMENYFNDNKTYRKQATAENVFDVMEFRE